MVGVIYNYIFLNILQEIENDQKEEEEEEEALVYNQNCLTFRLDEYKISKLIRKAIGIMKKEEIAEFICKDYTLIKHGHDFEILSKLGVLNTQ